MALQMLALLLSLLQSISPVDAQFGPDFGAPFFHGRHPHGAFHRRHGNDFMGPPPPFRRGGPMGPPFGGGMFPGPGPMPPPVFPPMMRGGRHHHRDRDRMMMMMNREMMMPQQPPPPMPNPTGFGGPPNPMGFGGPPNPMDFGGPPNFFNPPPPPNFGGFSPPPQEPNVFVPNQQIPTFSPPPPRRIPTFVPPPPPPRRMPTFVPPPPPPRRVPTFVPPPPRRIPTFAPPPPSAFSPSGAGSSGSFSMATQSLIRMINSRNAAFFGNGDYSRVVRALHAHYGRSMPGGRFSENTANLPWAGTPVRSEQAANRRILFSLYETDIVLSEQQARAILGTLRRRARRKVMTELSRKWTVARIPYRFAANDAAWQSVVRSALHFYERETCVRFQENGAGNDYLYFTQGNGCYSMVGRGGGQQEVSLGDGCHTLGLAAHEIAHALGLWHEQARPDRDQHVRILIQNAQAGTEGNFDKRRYQDAQTFGIPYDYGSVMHYAAQAFTRSSSLFTVDPLKPRYRSTLGNRVEPTFTDIKAINNFYCSGRCPTSLPCQSGGYPDPNNCNQCKCPEGLSGTYCERLKPSSCGSETTATGNWQTMSYSGAARCYWRINAPPGSRIRFEFTYVNYECAPACQEFVEAKVSSNPQITGIRMCCRAEPGEIISETNHLVLVSYATRSSQFTMRYKIEGGATIFASNQRSPPAPPTARSTALANRRPSRPHVSAPSAPRPSLPSVSQSRGGYYRG